MRTRRIAALLLVAFASSAVPTTFTRPAAAQADDAVTAEARKRFKEGVELYDKGRYEEARLAFLQAYTLKKHPAVLLNLAQSTAKAGHALEAAKYFKQFLKESTSVTPQQRKDAETGLADARQKLGRIEVVAPAGAELTLDDNERIGTAPLPEPVDVEPGPHSVKADGGEPVKVVAVVGQTVEANLGGGSAASPVTPVPVPAETPEQGPEPTTEPPAGADLTVKHTNLLSPPKNMTPFYIGLVVGGVGLVGAIVFAAFKADAQSKADAVASDIRRAAEARGLASKGICSSTDTAVQQDFGNACATLTANNNKVDTNATIANVSLGVMGAGLLFSGIYYLAAAKDDDKASSEPPAARGPVLTPYAGWGNAGLSLSGTF